MVVVGDWRFRDPAVRSAVDEIRALVAAGLRVAVAHLESYRAVYRLRFPLCGPIQQLVNDGVIDHVGLGDPGETTLLIVRQAAVLQFAADEAGGIRPQRVLVVADEAPARADGSDRRYDTATCTARAKALFGVDPVWWPQDAGIRAALTGVQMTSGDMPPIVDSTGWSETREAATSIVGADLGEPGDPRAVLHSLPEADVRLRLPDRPPSDVDLGLPRSWLVYAATDVAARPFLHQLDFYLHVPHPRALECLSRPALEAAAVGCIVVLPERYAALHGDAAVYAEPAAITDVIRRYTDDPALFAEQSRRARAVVAKAHHPQLFADRIAALLAPPVPPAPRNGAAAAGVSDVWPPGDLAPAGTPHP